MKNIILLLLLISFNSCNAQKDEKAKYFNINNYKDWKFDSIRCNPKYNKKCSRSDDEVYLMRGSERVTISTYDEAISVEKSDFINPYIYLDVFDVKTKRINGSYKYFLSSAREPIGISKEYNENGKLIKEKSWDKSYPFSIEDLVKKFKKEYSVNIEDRKNIFRLFRGHLTETNIPIYTVILKTDVENKWVEYLVDGNTGKTLYILKTSEGDDTDIFEEYLKSIGKFKGRTYKSDPATE